MRIWTSKWLWDDHIKSLLKQKYLNSLLKNIYFKFYRWSSFKFDHLDFTSTLHLQLWSGTRGPDKLPVLWENSGWQLRLWSTSLCYPFLQYILPNLDHGGKLVILEFKSRKIYIIVGSNSLWNMKMYNIKIIYCWRGLCKKVEKISVMIVYVCWLKGFIGNF